MDVFELIKDDHRTVDALMAEIEGATNDEERMELFEEMKMELTAHAKTEDKYVYSALEDADETKELIPHSRKEHKVVEDLLEELSTSDESGEAWMKKFMELKENVRHHVQEEENILLPKAEKIIDKEKSAELAKQMSAAKEDYM